MSKLYVGNISWGTNEEALAECFRQYGDVLDAKIILDRETGRSRGFGFITMGDAEQARVAIEKLDGHMLDGRPLRVNEAQDRNDNRGRGGYGGGGRGRDDHGGRNDRGGRKNGRRDRGY
jgi:cold-inducible RNA-binding protein